MNTLVRQSKGAWIALCMKSFLALVLGVMAQQIHAEEPKDKSAVPVLTNIGFMKNPPKELKEKFPMCDAFLKVEWIDKEKKIGYSRYELYGEGGQEKRKTSALIYLNRDFPRFAYDLGVEERSGRMQKVFSLIKQGEVVPYFTGQCSCNLEIQYKEDGQTVAEDFSPRESEYSGTLADNRKNVCIPYPDNQRMWIAEGKQAGKIYSSEELARINKELTESGLDSFPLEESVVMDINLDGVNDYFAGIRVAYSYGGRFYESTPLNRGKKNIKKIPGAEPRGSFPPNQKTCDDLPTGEIYFTTDGRNIYLSNQCNLTKLIKAEE
jgi:hypothetical protein